MPSPPELTQAIADEISLAAGPGNFSTSTKKRLLYSADAKQRQVFPAGVVRTADAERVAAVMAVCYRHKIPMVPRGAGSGLTGGALPAPGSVVLDMSGMNRILSINPHDQTAVVQPGVITANLQKAAEKQGLFYPPDPASVNFCTLGGNVAENAGGLRAVKYGVTRDYVLALKAVLPDGRPFKTASGTLKNVVGYDLTRLLVGSEGTLAVITELTLRLLPLPEAKRTLNAYYPTLEQGAAAVQAVLASGIRPAALEFMDQATLRAVNAFAKLGLPEGAEALVLVDIDGPPEVLARQAETLGELLKKAGGDPVSIAATAKEIDELWAARRMAGPAILSIAPDKLNEDIVVPLSALAEMVRRVQAIGEKYQVATVSFGHAGDGNLHVNLMYDAGQPGQEDGALGAVNEVFAQALALGGSLSGEHGVGNTKIHHFPDEVDPVALAVMQRIKKAFDPEGLLNPGKAVPAPESGL